MGPLSPAQNTETPSLFVRHSLPSPLNLNLWGMYLYLLRYCTEVRYASPHTWLDITIRRSIETHFRQFRKAKEKEEKKNMFYLGSI